MFNLETALSTWRHYFAQRRGFQKEDLDELERHVRDHVRHAVEQGIPEEEAFWEAVREVGDYDGAEEEYRKVYWGKLRRRHQIKTELGVMFSMWKNYLKIAWRNALREKGYAAINIFGLAVGLAFCTLIFLYVRDERTYDRFHTKADRIYRIQEATINSDGSISSGSHTLQIPLGPALKADIPEIVQYVRFVPERHYVRAAGASADAIEEDVLFADPSVLQVFTFPLRHGNPATALAGLDGVVLTESMARKYFGEDNPTGKILQIRLDQTFEDFVVTGVAEDVPGNSTIRFGILLSFQKLLADNDFYRQWADSWNFFTPETYVELAEGATARNTEAKFPAFFEKYHRDETTEQSEEGIGDERKVPTYRLQPIRQIHLESDSSPIYSYILSGIALAVLLIACINFMTLSVGRSVRRAREVGVRKAIGAGRLQLMGQFWGEAFVLSGISLLLSLLLVKAFLPVFNHLTGKTLRLDFTADWTIAAMLVGLVLLTGLVAGSYPALVLSGFRPVEILTNRFRLSGSNAFTKSLVVFQFALSVFLVVSALIMTRQLAYTRSVELGFDEEQIVVIPLQGLDGSQVAARFRNALQSQPRVVGVTATGNTLGNTGSMGVGFQYEGKHYAINVFSVETNYLDFLGLDLIAGRNFDPGLATDTTHSFIVNEALVRAFNLDDPVGKPIPGLPGVSPENAPVIIGVVRDYHFQSLYKTIGPVILTLNPDWKYHYLFVRIRPDDIPGTLDLLEKTWRQSAPDLPFAYQFLDDQMQAQYADDQRWSQIVRYATLFAVLIACLGLLGLAALTVARRTKEIGIRKVLGASAAGIVTLLSKDFLKLVLIAFVLAAPLAYLAMSRWLEDFAYRIELGPGIFLIAGGLALLLALATVSYQAVKAALADPVTSLRYE